MSDRMVEHVRLFNEGVRTADWTAFVATFTPDAVMQFEGVPVGPYVGREEIGAAYASRPPDDTMTLRSVTAEDEREMAEFAWDAGGGGTLRIRWRGDEVAELTVVFAS